MSTNSDEAQTPATRVEAQTAAEQEEEREDGSSHIEAPAEDTTGIDGRVFPIRPPKTGRFERLALYTP